MNALSGPVSGHEIELKLTLSGDAMAKLKRSHIFDGDQLLKPKTSRLISIYWDTPEGTLAAQGIVLKLRAEGRSRTQTVKTAGLKGAALHARREWEWPVLSDQPNGHLLETTGLKPFADPDLMARLIPVYTSDFRRTTHRIGGDDWEVYVALDEGKVIVGALSDPICEVELELRRGPASNLVDLAKRVVQTVPARLQTLPKSERGKLLAVGWSPSPQRAAPENLKPSMPVSSAFRAIARNCINQLVANEHCLLASGDPESVHQMRVALRRLRSAMKLFRDVLADPDHDAVRGELNWLQSCLGPARDTHVFLEEIVTPVLSAHPEMATLLTLHSRWHHESAAHLAAAQEAVRDPRFTLLILTTVGWIEAGRWASDSNTSAAMPIRDYARLSLTKQDKRLRRSATDHPERLPDEPLHRLRILCKQLRYTGEFFTTLFPRRESAANLAALAALQDLLGQLNDIAVAQARLTGLPSAADGGLAWAAGLIAGWHAGRRPELRGQVAKLWRRYAKAPRYWSLD